MMAPSRRSFVCRSSGAALTGRCPGQIPSFCLFFWALFTLFSNTHALPSSSLAPVAVTPPQNAHAATSAVVVQDNFLGISFELNSFDTLWGKSPQQMPIPIQNYLANLRARIHSPLRIRIGGNSMDSSTYVSNQTDMIVLTDPNAYFNDVPVDFGPAFFEVLNAMADIVGEMQFMITLSMQHPQNDTDVIDLAKAGRDMLGSRLDSMLLGNEPDLYAGHGTRANYTIQDYIPEIGEVLDDLRNSPYGNLIPKTIIGGPTICCSWNLSDVLDAGLTQYPYKYYTLQHYPTHTCNGPNAKNTNITYFVSHTNVPVFAQWQSKGIQMGRSANVPVLMTEYNSVSCGGSNVSDTFAAALWAVDVALGFASYGLSAAYLHTREYQVLYNLFDPATPSDSMQPGWRTGSPYYSALLLSETFPQGGVVVLDLNLDNSISNAAATVAGYALYGQNGTVCERLVLINFGDDAGTPRNFSLAPGIAHSAGVRLLAAPSIAETTQIAWAGQIVGRNGELEGKQSTQYYTGCANGCNISVPGPGAALVLLGDTEGNSSFYVGNSTVAGIVGFQNGSMGVPEGSSSSAPKTFGGHEWAWVWTTTAGVLAVLHALF